MTATRLWSRLLPRHWTIGAEILREAERARIAKREWPLQAFAAFVVTEGSRQVRVIGEGRAMRASWLLNERDGASGIVWNAHRIED